jgi:hypothetical protein
MAWILGAMVASQTQNLDALSGTIALIGAGSCNFTVKVKHAQTAGALAVVIANNKGGNGTSDMTGVDTTIKVINGLQLSFFGRPN